ncbi:hypothetical protein CIHG_05775 [Coccidioides immitis H538.4]|uniref:Uncharacterized protein n=1 Tax=Coccidioides immitis H538.4 TaxID=396776 RepID=A0A0J8RT87_COCIT|nr:hypothetical protein CIHG_05775 [Coccidioides immitis H538.4]
MALRTTKLTATLARTQGVSGVADLEGFPAFIDLDSALANMDVGLGSMYPTNERGAQSRPIRKESEKFKVARAERKRPRRARNCKKAVSRLVLSMQRQKENWVPGVRDC